MNSITIITFHNLSNTIHAQFLESSLIQKIIFPSSFERFSSHPKCEIYKFDSLFSGKSWNFLINKIKTKFFLVAVTPCEIKLGQNTFERLISVADDTRAGIIYSNYYDAKNGATAEHPLNEYQLGSIRDDFDFGPMMLFSTEAVKRSLKKYGKLKNSKFAGLYELRLKTSLDYRVFLIQEYLYTKKESGYLQKGEKQFDYVDPRNRNVQIEFEKAATEHLKRIDAWLAPKFLKTPKYDFQFPVEASVIIPVKNRLQTVGDAVKSVLEQKTDFSFNCIVVDNYSTDGTTYLLRELSENNPQVKHIIPQRTDLGIGGCWNEALYSKFCGKYAIQLDSDDLYSGTNVIQKIVDEFRKNKYAMVIGSYTLVNMELKEIPPGIIDHREWTLKNGRNNALRINGLGAPRAFNTALLRELGGFPNVNYGEDYAVALRITRDYQIGRIYEPLYLCRRWEGNTDAKQTVEQMNRNNFYKDKIRTIEILARQQINRKRK